MTNSKIRIEENGRFQFDFSALEYVWEFHDVVAKTALSDVDFITETNENDLLNRSGDKKSDVYQSGYVIQTAPSYNAYMNLVHSV